LSEDGSRKRGWRSLLRPAGKVGGSSRRTLLVRAAVVCAVLAVFVVAPGYISSRPAFLQRYSQLDAPYGSWSRSAHAAVPCQRCHVSPAPLAQASYDAKMLGEFYLSMVMPGRQPKLFDKPTNAACSSCHTDLRTVSPSGDLNIPHRAHVDVLRLNCIDCHKYLVHEVSPAGTHKPWMAGCLRCHDGHTAKNDCSACHTDKVEPLAHRSPDWLVVHPQKANADCQKCHAWTQHWCANCHAKRPQSHGTDWRSQHGAQVKKHRNCEACHTGDFCARCHGEVPQANFNPALKLVQ
jgi:hypothetical protein